MPHNQFVLPTVAPCAGSSFDLLVMNHEVGITGVVTASAESLEDAIRRYEQTNPHCVVISLVANDD